VVEWIEESHDFTVHKDGAGDPYVLTERLGDTLGNTGFSVARVPIQEHTTAAVDGWAKSIQKVVRDQKVCKGPLEIFSSGVLGFDGLKLDRSDVVFDRDGSRAEVGRFEQVASRSIPTCIGEDMDVVVHRSGASVDRQLLHFESRQYGLDQAKREFEMVRDTAAGHLTAAEQESGNDLFDDRFRKAGMF
jgi:hypothetical protein